jgi:hypothetical protein
MPYSAGGQSTPKFEQQSILPRTRGIFLRLDLSSGRLVGFPAVFILYSSGSNDIVALRTLPIHIASTGGAEIGQTVSIPYSQGYFTAGSCCAKTFFTRNIREAKVNTPAASEGNSENVIERRAEVSLSDDQNQVVLAGPLPYVLDG